MSYSFLSTFGLTEKEILLYQLLLNNGQLGAGKLVEESKLKRATAYQSLYSLEKKGLVSHFEVSGKIIFKLESPNKLLELANLQLKNFEESHSQLMSVISSLNSQYIQAVEKPVISVFEGIEGLKQIYNDTLIAGKPIYAALTIEEMDPELKKWLDRVYVKRKEEKKIKAYVLVAQGEGAKDYLSRNKEELRETKLVDKKLYPFKHEIDIYGDKVAFINYKKGTNLLGVLIHHPLIATTMKALFDLAWTAK